MSVDLSGRTVLVTRAAENAAAWAQAVESCGGRALVLPCLACEPMGGAATGAALRAALETADWLVLTSVRGVEQAADMLEGALPPQVRIAAVGPATATATEARFGRVNWTCARGTGEALARDLAGLFALEYESGPQRVVVAAADRARHHLEAVLEKAGHELVRISIYRTVPAAPRKPREDLAAAGVNVILLASPSAVEGLLAQADIPEQTAIVTIGPTTSDAARAAGLTVAAEAARPSLEGLLEVIP